MNIVLDYFPNFSETQKNNILALKDIYEFWNSRINVISRKDFHNFYEHHVLHSLSIASYIKFKTQTEILDIGTGGGFPGIPLAIAFPNSRFHLVDSIGKKIKVVNEVCNALQLKNVNATQVRIESIKEKSYDFAVSRAVTTLPKLVAWIKDKIKIQQENDLHNGLLYLKGGDFGSELEALKQKYYVYNLSDKFKTPFFETKKLVHVEL